MIRRYATFISLFRSVSDILAIAGIWLSVFYLRFHSGLFATTKGIPDFKRHLMLTMPVVLICYLSCVFTGFYKLKRAQNIIVQFIEILKAGFFSGLFTLAFFYYLQDVPYSRKLLILFIIMIFIGLFFSHLFTIVILRHLRAKGCNLCYFAVIGTNPNGRQLLRDIEKMNWLGLKCVCFVDDNLNDSGAELMGVPVYSPIEKLVKLVKTAPIDEVYLALSGSDAQKAYPVLKILQSLGVTVRIIPDWSGLASISNTTIITVGTQVLFSAADSPLSGISIILKEVFDRTVALILLTILAVPMLVIAILVKLTSKGPVFYKQIRMGMDQKEFEILKFRSMKVTQEAKNNPKWTILDDPRCTAFGAWLRKTSIDELPQLINVLKGQMSLVGPRPERPVFIGKFSEEYTEYMLRHKVKAGMTGLAQIKGFRGDTSLKKRLAYDLYYVRNWSWKLDMWILWQTPQHIIIGKNAY